MSGTLRSSAALGAGTKAGAHRQARFPRGGPERDLRLAAGLCRNGSVPMAVLLGACLRPM